MSPGEESRITSRYEEALAYLDGFVDYERKPPTGPARAAMGLERIRELLAELGDPHLGLRCVHIAGTKGKGSTAAMTASALAASGYRTGLYTSPHLVDVRERIQISGRPISQEEFVSCLDRTRPHLEKTMARAEALPPDAPFRRPTYFEILTHLAFLHFAASKVDAAVVEVGMGGRFDATNVIGPLACAITAISLDHTAILGSTLEAIAAEKAGILKQGVPAVIGPQEGPALRAICEAARRIGAPLWTVGREVALEDAGEGEPFSVRTPGLLYKNLDVALWGAHQRENAAVAVGLLELARASGLDRITPETVRDGLARTRWPGRVQPVSERPLTVIDGAHNGASVMALFEALRARLGAERLAESPPTVVFAAAADKDLAGMLSIIARRSSSIILTTSGSPRGAAPELLAGLIDRERTRAAVEVEPDPVLALEKARARAGEGGLVAATGSLYLAGVLLGAMGRSP